MKNLQLLALLPLLFLALSCGDAAVPGAVNVDEEDVGSDSSGIVVDEDASTDQGPDAQRDTADGLSVGEFCTEDAECNSGLCLYLAPELEEGFCSRWCRNDEGCPEGFDCIYVEADDGVAQVCVPEDLCYDDDEDGYGVGPGCLGSDCDEEDPERNPGVVEICDDVDNDCDELVDENPSDANIPCETGIGGPCAEGIVRCIQGQTMCEQRRFATVETCDGADNDCDGQIDEGDDGESLKDPCYGGDPETIGVGACREGYRACEVGQWSACQDEVLPFPEQCDGIDNDCDGEFDENRPGTGVACETELPGICREGETRCNDQGQLVCASLSEAATEVCDGLDNDCDGQFDEDSDGEALSRACYEGQEGTQDIGLCVGGQQMCDTGLWGRCVDQLLPTDELCDGEDNDCDGEPDEGNPSGGLICSTGQPGVCSRGETACTEQGTVCLPVEIPDEESCDGMDNDCDAVVDEDEQGDPLQRRCYNGPDGTADIGQCRSGQQTCTGGDFAACLGEVRPRVEVCDGEDNDCDGLLDDGNPGGNQNCSTGLDGICAAGVTECRDAEVVCLGLMLADLELCDGEDNDCDGAVDENEQGDPLDRTCYNGPEGTADIGQCRSGRQRCQDGTFGVCQDEIRPQPERCDGEDNDCDGAQDNGNPGGGAPCSTGQPGACATGVTSCQNADVVCVQQNEPEVETCDGFDNDCDGVRDEDQDDQPLARVCYNGPEGTGGVGLCRVGQQVCVEGVYDACAGQVLPRDEVCDGLDNDCDGTADDANPGGGVACTTGMMGVCARGITSCSDGALVCQQQVEAGVEICDGLDNDCDGAIDEDDNGDPLYRTCYDGQDGEIGNGRCAAGMQLCRSGVFGSCQGQVLPVQEICDNFDNDCDGSIDNGDPGGGVDCTTGIPGICALGQTTCRGGEIVCNALAEPAQEVCDGIDQDCDGSPDNGFDGLGSVCFAGDGLCRRAGVIVCDPDAPEADPICDAIPGEGAQESCNLIDDDCDGNVDEDFKQDGVYLGAEHCGSCDINCNALWPGGPEAFHVVPSCALNDGVALCAFACEGSWEDADQIPDNGCEFLPDSDGIYVSTPVNGGRDRRRCGAWDSPCATLTMGISRAGSTNRSKVLVSAGLYRESVAVVDGVSLLGGYNARTWRRQAAVYVTTISGNAENQEGPDRAAITIQGVQSATEISGFSINAEPADIGGNSMGFWISDPGSALVVRDNVVFGSDGGSGTDGGTGQAGQSGGEGRDGGDSLRRNNCNFTGSGPAGGARNCANPMGGQTNVSGGDGGDSTCPTGDERNGTGSNGRGPNGGSGGLGGGHFIGSRSRCTVGLPPDPQPGQSGASGSDGAGGGGADDNQGFIDPQTGHWRGQSGSSGVDGAHGSGGGGGGAAAGVNATGVNGGYYYGATGGSGGSGGCAGFAGQAGNSGGSSFAIFIVYTQGPPQNPDAMPSILDNRLIRGRGGNGGQGGLGGGGGDPGQGGLGGGGVNEGEHGFCMFDGAVGAPGGRGGHGGGGGGGAGGSSWDLYIGGAGGNDPGYADSNTFDLPDDVFTGGAGGTGGNSSNVQIGVGDTGRDGEFGTVAIR